MKSTRLKDKLLGIEWTLRSERDDLVLEHLEGKEDHADNDGYIGGYSK